MIYVVQGRQVPGVYDLLDLARASCGLDLCCADTAQLKSRYSSWSRRCGEYEYSCHEMQYWIQQFLLYSKAVTMRYITGMLVLPVPVRERFANGSQTRTRFSEKTRFLKVWHQLLYRKKPIYICWGPRLPFARVFSRG